MDFIQRLRERSKSDKGDAILVMSVLFIPFMFLITGFAMDLTKAVYVKQQYQIMGQEATSAAARQVNTNGSIRADAAQTVVGVYADRFRGQDRSAVNYGNNDNYTTNEAGVGVRNSVCKTVTLEDGSKRQAPYMVITLSGGRNDKDSINGTPDQTRFTSEGEGAVVQDPSTNYNPNVRYYAINATIYDVAPNLMLGMFGRPCQQVRSEVSSITFGSQEDVFDFEDENVPACPATNFKFANSNSIQWDAVANAQGYKLFSKNASGAILDNYTTTGTFYSNSIINSSDTSKSWYLQAQDAKGAFLPCGTLTPTSSSSPSCPTIEFIWDDDYTIAWYPVPSAVKYRIQSSKAPGVWVDMGSNIGYSNFEDASNYSSSKPISYVNDVGVTWTLQAAGSNETWVNCGTLQSRGTAPACFDITRSGSTLNWTTPQYGGLNPSGYTVAISSPYGGNTESLPGNATTYTNANMNIDETVTVKALFPGQNSLNQCQGPFEPPAVPPAPTAANCPTAITRTSTTILSPGDRSISVPMTVRHNYSWTAPNSSPYFIQIVTSSNQLAGASSGTGAGAVGNGILAVTHQLRQNNTQAANPGGPYTAVAKIGTSASGPWTITCTVSTP